MKALFCLSTEFQTRVLIATRKIVKAAPLCPIPSQQGGVTTHWTTSAGAVGWSPKYGGRFVAWQGHKKSWPAIPQPILEVVRQACTLSCQNLQAEHVSVDWMTGPNTLPERLNKRSQAPSILVCLGDSAWLSLNNQEHLVTSGQVFWLAQTSYAPEVLEIDAGSSTLALSRAGHLQLHIRQLWDPTPAKEPT